MRFDWDAKKAATNLRNHDVSFDEAASVFLDPMARSGPDSDHSTDEGRYVTFALSRLGRLSSSAMHTALGQSGSSVPAA
jgi:hypothetical protein